MVEADSDRVSRAPPYLGYLHQVTQFRLSGYHTLWRNFPVVFIYLVIFWLNLYAVTYSVSPTTPNIQRLQAITYTRFRLFQFRSPLLPESLVYFLFVLLLRCFSSQAFLLSTYVFSWGLPSFNSVGFPHSDSHGSILFSSSPWLFVALHVLRRLSVPRHPPLALCSFTYRICSLSIYILLVSLMITFIFLYLFNNSLSNIYIRFTLIILCNFQCAVPVSPLETK